MVSTFPRAVMTFLKSAVTAVTVGNVFINPFPIDLREDGKQRKQTTTLFLPRCRRDKKKKVRTSLPPCQQGL